MGGLGKDWVADYDTEHVRWRTLGHAVDFSALNFESDLGELKYDFTKPKSFTFSFDIQNINTEALRLLYGADLFDNKEDTTSMTITADTKKQPTRNTPDGTIVRLTDRGRSMSAKPGALAVVDRSKQGMWGDATTHLIVRWIKGANGQQDGGYNFEQFDLTGFAAGDRVRINPGAGATSEAGCEGVLLAEARNGNEVQVKIDKGRYAGHTLSYNLAHLENISEDLLAEWEKELLAPAKPEPKFKAGDIVVINDTLGMRAWVGRRFRVKKDSMTANTWLVNGSIDSRPEGMDIDFMWPNDGLRAFDPTRDFKIGDRAKVIDNRGAASSAVKGDVVTIKNVGEPQSHLYPGHRLLTVKTTDRRTYQMYDFRFELVSSEAPKSEPKWKVGDAFEIYGQTYYVVEQAQEARPYHGDLWVHVSTTPGGRHTNIWRTDELATAKRVEPKPSPKFKVGDRVYFSGQNHPPHVYPGTIVGPQGAGRYDVNFDGLSTLAYREDKLTALKPEDDPKLKPAPLKVGDKITNERFGELPQNSVIFQPNNLKSYPNSVLRTAAVKTGNGPTGSGGGAFQVTGQQGYKYAKDFSGEYTVLQLGRGA